MLFIQQKRMMNKIDQTKTQFCAPKQPKICTPNQDRSSSTAIVMQTENSIVTQIRPDESLKHCLKQKISRMIFHA